MNSYSIGIDLGGTKILTVLADKKTGEVLSFVKVKTKKDKGRDKLIKKIIKSVKEVIIAADKKLSEIENIGMGAAGQTDRQNGIIINAPNIGLENVPVKEILEKEFSKPVYLGNDVEVATIGEIFFGSGKGETDFVCIFAGTGVGSCIVQNGKIRYGATGTAGEIGHIIIEPNGRLCGCGAKGCLEAYASRLAIEKKIRAELNRGVNSDIINYMKEDKPIKTAMLKKALENNDKTVIDVLDETCFYLSLGIASIINFYNPSKIILGGGLINGIDYFYEKTVRLSIENSLAVPAQKIVFERARLGDFSGAVGAAMLADYREIFLDDKNC